MYAPTQPKFEPIPLGGSRDIVVQNLDFPGGDALPASVPGSLGRSPSPSLTIFNRGWLEHIKKSPGKV